MAIVWCMVPEICSTTDRIFGHFGLFLPFYPTNNSKKSKFWKMKKTPGHIILHMCKLIAKYDIHNSWDMEGNQQNFLSFWTIFCSWTPQTPKIKILKKWKTHVEILSFYILQMCTINNNHMMNGSCNMRSDR